MSEKDKALYDADFTYKKENITTSLSKEGYPIIERTNNALLYPETPKDNLDFDNIE